MDIQKNGFLSIEQLTNQYLHNTRKQQTDGRGDGLSFQEILQQKTEGTVGAETLTFSKHATGRLEDRNIELSTSQLERLNDGARKAGEKGIKDSLVIVDELAFIVNIPNRTVVTAINSMEATDNVFTNINGAVIM